MLLGLAFVFRLGSPSGPAMAESTSTAAGSSDSAASSVFVWGVYAGVAILLHATKSPGSRRAQWAWFVTALAAIMWSVTFEGSPVLHWTLIASSFSALGCLCAWIAWARLFRDRGNHPARAAALFERDRARVMDRYHRAVEWNRVRAALLGPGRVVVVVGPVPTLAGTPVPGRRWTYDPRTGVETVRVIAEEVPRGSWVVVDDEDQVIATAPARAPEAWLDALRVGVPRHC
jgi:hypothetical protein